MMSNAAKNFNILATSLNTSYIIILIFNKIFRSVSSKIFRFFIKTVLCVSSNNNNKRMIFVPHME